MNDYAGMPAYARGIWDDENRKVLLLEMFPDPGEQSLGDVPRRKGG